MRDVGLFWKEVLLRTFREYESLSTMIGFVLVFLVAAGYGKAVNDEYLTWASSWAAVAYVVAHLALLTPQRMWTESQAKLAALEDRQRPRLRLLFVPDELPYTQELLPAQSDTIVRIFRVGIRNDSSLIIKNVRVVLESWTWRSDELVGVPTPKYAVLIEHALNVMGSDKKHGRIDVAPGNGPTAFADVVSQPVKTAGYASPHISPCYASGHKTPIAINMGEWVMGLRVEGGGTCSRAEFTIKRDEDGRVLMTPRSLT